MQLYRGLSGARERLSGVSRRPARATARPLLRMGGWLVAFLVLVGGLFGPVGAQIAHASATRVTLPQNGPGNTSSLHLPSIIQPNAPLIQYHPKIYLVFWGSGWSNDSDGVISQVQNTFNTLAGSEYNNILSQYNDGTGNPDGYVHNDVELMGTWVDTRSSSLPSYIDITNEGGNEEKDAVSHFGLPAGNHPIMNDTQIILFPQKGTSYLGGGDFCGMHYFDTTTQAAYSMIQYSSSTFCHHVSNDRIAQDMTWTAIHEYVEAATDTYVYGRIVANLFPFTGNGWQTNELTQTTPDEIADICQGWGDPNTYQDPETGISSTLPYIWSKADNACVNSVGQDYFSYTYPYKHTVQGLILTEYQSKEQTLGSPLSEETPIAGGRVSYFNSTCGGTNTCAGIYWKSGESAAYIVWGVDFTRYMNLGGPSKTMGFPLTDEQNVTNPYSHTSGTWQYFSGGCSVPTACAGLYYSPATGSFPVWGGNYARYNNVLKGPGGIMGFPLTEEQNVTNPYSHTSGTQQFFTEKCSGNTACAAIYASPATASQQVWGGNFALYNSLGGPGSVMGFPITQEQPMNGGTVQYFTEKCSGNTACAAIYTSPATASQQVWGGNYADYVRLGEANGSLAFPLTPEINVSGGTAQYFTANQGCGTPGPSGSDGAIYANPNIGSYAVYGCIYAFYQQWGGLNSIFGFPMSDETGMTDYWGNPGRVNYFQGSYCGTTNHPGSAIYWWTGAHEVHGCIFDTYYRMNGPNSKLGFPISDEYTNSLGHPESDFSNGEIVWENGSAVVLYDTSCVTTGKCN